MPQSWVVPGLLLRLQRIVFMWKYVHQSVFILRRENLKTIENENYDRNLPLYIGIF
jgi:hypothetical protein